MLDRSVAQPPLPLQEFLPLQPLSLDLQPPLPLQEFLPLQACFSFTFLSDFWSGFLSASCAPVEPSSPFLLFVPSILAPVRTSTPPLCSLCSLCAAEHADGRGGVLQEQGAASLYSGSQNAASRFKWKMGVMRLQR